MNAVPVKDGPVRCVAPVGDVCGEAVTWSERDGAVYWTDVCRFLVHRLDATGSTRSWEFDETVVALSTVESGSRLLVALGSRLLLWDPATDARDDAGFSLPGWPGVRLNDGRAAPNGDFWIGSMGNNVAADGTLLPLPPGQGVLMQFAGSTKPRIWKTGLGISNTVCWSPDALTFYFGDSERNCIWACDQDPATGELSRERLFFEGFPRGKPDGSCVDAEGYLWNARFGGACVVRVAPDGQVDRVLEMPVRNITTCAFGGAGLSTLYITTARLLAPESDRLAGSLFAFDPPVPGAPAHALRWPLAERT